MSDYVKLNKDQHQFLKAIRPFEYDTNYFDSLAYRDTVVPGMYYEYVEAMTKELMDIGYITVGSDQIFDKPVPVLSSTARQYERITALRALTSAARFAGSVLTGASGGLVVYLLTRFFS